MPDDPLDALLHSDPVIGAVLYVVVAQSHPKVLHVVLAHAEMKSWKQFSSTKIRVYNHSCLF